MSEPEIAHGPIGGTVSVVGFCDTHSGEAGCFGQRKVTKFGEFWFCARHFPHRKRLSKQLANAARRKD